MTDEELLTKAAKQGAREALKEVGLGDENAGQDIRDLRKLLEAWNRGKSIAFKTIVMNITTGCFVLILLGLAFKMGVYIKGD